jgi:hypothetical protein
MDGMLRNQVLPGGDRLQYYAFNGELYTATFPKDWLFNCKPGTGPKDCRNCLAFGSWNGVFIGYCANCAFYQYNGYRGRGFIRAGQESNDADVQAFESVFDTYLKDVAMDEIGDKDLFVDSKAIVN